MRSRCCWPERGPCLAEVAEGGPDVGGELSERRKLRRQWSRVREWCGAAIPPPLPRTVRTEGGRRYEERGPSGPSTVIEEEAAQAQESKSPVQLRSGWEYCRCQLVFLR